MTEYEKIFAERLKQVRLAKGLKGPQLAEKISVSKAAISQFESGKSRPCLDVLARLADALDVSVDFLLGRTDNPKVSKPRKVTTDEV